VISPLLREPVHARRISQRAAANRIQGWPQCPSLWLAICLNPSRPSAPQCATTIGGAAPVPESGPLRGVHQSPELRPPIRDAADGAVPPELLFLAEFCSAPVAGAIQLVQGVEPCGQKGVAPLKRSRRCFFGIVRSDPHAGQNSPLWLKKSCEPGPRGRALKPSFLFFSVRVALQHLPRSPDLRGPAPSPGLHLPDRSKMRCDLFWSWAC
jgi:hypothetical protein